MERPFFVLAIVSSVMVSLGDVFSILDLCVSTSSQAVGVVESAGAVVRFQLVSSVLEPRYLFS